MRTNSKKVSDLTMWSVDRFGKSGRESNRQFSTFARGAQWRFFQGSGILHLGKIAYRLTHHYTTLPRN